MVCDTGSKILQANIEIEDGRDADRAEEANKPGVSEMLDLVDLLVHGHDDRQASE